MFQQYNIIIYLQYPPRSDSVFSRGVTDVRTKNFEDFIFISRREAVLIQKCHQKIMASSRLSYLLGIKIVL